MTQGNNMLNKVELVIPTHWSKKGHDNGSWGPPTDGWVRKTIESLYERCPDARSVNTTVSQNVQHPRGDGNKPEDDYTKTLRRFCDEFGFTLRLDYSPGFRGMRLGMCEWVQAPYLFLLEHDWEFQVDLDLVSLIQTFEKHDHVNYIRFNKRANFTKEVLTATRRVGGDLYLLEDKRLDIPLLTTPQYSNNPHVERMSKYREWCKIVEDKPVFSGGNGGAGGFEHPLQEQSLTDLERYGAEKRDAMWGTYIYGKPGDPPAVVHFGI